MMKSINMFVLTMAALLLGSEAFQASVKPIKVRTALDAWSLQMPDNMVFKSTWYDDHNPTARRTIYEDTASEFRFVSAGSDWPSLSDAEEQDSKEFADSKNRAAVNPIRRAAQWIARRRQQS